MADVKVICSPDNFLLSYSKNHPKYANIYCRIAWFIHFANSVIKSEKSTLDTGKKKNGTI